MKINIHTTVHHNHYGKGEVIKITDENVYVLFGKKQRIFPYPDAFEKGYLMADITSPSPVIIPHPITYLGTKEQSSAIVSANPTREITLDAADNISYKTIYEALNAAVGTNYTGWMKATWPSVYTSLPFRIWFPKLAETKNGKKVSAAFDCVNTISNDWNEVVYDNLKDGYVEGGKQYTGVNLIFAKEPEGGPYVFRGVFERNIEKTKQNHHVYKRIGTKVKLIGQPAEQMVILDDFRN